MDTDRRTHVERSTNLDEAVEKGQHIVDLDVRRQALHQHGRRHRCLDVVGGGLRRDWRARVPVDDGLVGSSGRCERCGRAGRWRTRSWWRRSCVDGRRQADGDDSVDTVDGLDGVAWYSCRRQLHLSRYSARRACLVREWSGRCELRRQKRRGTCTYPHTDDSLPHD